MAHIHEHEAFRSKEVVIGNVGGDVQLRALGPGLGNFSAATAAKKRDPGDGRLQGLRALDNPEAELLLHVAQCLLSGHGSGEFADAAEADGTVFFGHHDANVLELQPAGHGTADTGDDFVGRGMGGIDGHAFPDSLHDGGSHGVFAVDAPHTLEDERMVRHHHVAAFRNSLVNEGRGAVKPHQHAMDFVLGRADDKAAIVPAFLNAERCECFQHRGNIAYFHR